MKVLFAASELTPIAKVGGLGDVIGALPKALARMGVSVSIVIPRYSFIQTKGLRQIADRVPVAIGGKREPVSLWRTEIPGSRVTLFLIENPTYLSTGPGPYFERSALVGARREIERFAFFSKAVFELMRLGHLEADVLHGNDWHTGLLVSLIAHHQSEESKNLKLKTLKTVFTIHNLANQGKWDAKNLRGFLFGGSEEDVTTPCGKDVNMMAEGILSADRVTTVSPTYAKEILTKGYGEGLEGILRTRRRDLSGILNGIDYDFFNPTGDPLLHSRYTVKNIAIGKQANKIFLQKKLKLPVVPVPLFGLVSRLTPQKGIDFIVGTLPHFIKQSEGQFVFLGQGVKEYEVALENLARRFPDRVAVHFDFDEKLAHAIYAGSDFFLMPSRFEPCGLGQMIAMRYGTLPVVRATGGLKDSVVNGKTGFVFNGASVTAFGRALHGAASTYAAKPKTFEAMRHRAMRANFDFVVSAKSYAKLYRELMKER